MAKKDEEVLDRLSKLEAVIAGLSSLITTKLTGARDFKFTRKITLSNYDPNKKYETEDYGVTHDSFKEARAEVEPAVRERIEELHGFKEVKTKE
jgi:hypothetical protein